MNRSITSWLIVALLWILAVVMVTYTAQAQSCEPDFMGRPAIAQCVPPATYQLPRSEPPFDAPVRYGGEIKIGNHIHWLWLKAAEPSRPCTAAEIAQGQEYKRACAAKIGDVLYTLRRWKQ